MAGRHLRILREEQVRFSRERVFGIRENMPGDRYFQKPLEGRELMRHHFPSKFAFQDFKVQEFVEMHEERYRPRQMHQFQRQFQDTIASIRDKEVQHTLGAYFSRVTPNEFYASEPLQDLYSLYRMVVPAAVDNIVQFKVQPKVRLDHDVLPSYYPFRTMADAADYNKWLIYEHLDESADLDRQLRQAQTLEMKWNLLEETMKEMNIQRPLFLDAMAKTKLDFCLIIEQARNHDDFDKKKFMEHLKSMNFLSEIRKFLDAQVKLFGVKRSLIGEEPILVNRRVRHEDSDSSSEAVGDSHDGVKKQSDVNDIDRSKSSADSNDDLNMDAAFGDPHGSEWIKYGGGTQQTSMDSDEMHTMNSDEMHMMDPNSDEDCNIREIDCSEYSDDSNDGSNLSAADLHLAERVFDVKNEGVLPNKSSEQTSMDSDEMHMMDLSSNEDCNSSDNEHSKSSADSNDGLNIEVAFADPHGTERIKKQSSEQEQRVPNESSRQTSMDSDEMPTTDTKSQDETTEGSANGETGGAADDETRQAFSTVLQGRVNVADVKFITERLTEVQEPISRGHPEKDQHEAPLYQRRHRFIDPMFRRRRLKWLERLKAHKSHDREVKYNPYYIAHPDNQERWPLNKGSVIIKYPSRYH